MLEDFATSHLQQAMKWTSRKCSGMDTVCSLVDKSSAIENLSLQICDQGLQAEPPIGRLNHGKSKVKHIKLSPQAIQRVEKRMTVKEKAEVAAQVCFSELL
jgi:hypothetical protein